MPSLSFSRLITLACAMVIALPLFASKSFADELDLHLSPVFSVEDSMLLAQAEAASNENIYTAPDPRISKEKNWLSGKRIHQYLGFGSILFAGAAGLARPESEAGVAASSSRKDLHRALGITAAALGGAAIANGFYVHGDDFNIENGWLDPDNLHVLLTVAGTLAYGAAIITNGKGMHAAAGIGGFALMETGMLLEW